jgi:hypothetical protein
VKLERNIQLGKPGCRCENNIKIIVKEIVCVCIDWIKMTKDFDKLRFDYNKSLIDCGLDKIRGNA